MIPAEIIVTTTVAFILANPLEHLTFQSMLMSNDTSNLVYFAMYTIETIFSTRVAAIKTTHTRPHPRGPTTVLITAHSPERLLCAHAHSLRGTHPRLSRHALYQ